ncbi:TraB/GumN family protein [Chromatium okenii]|jgi:pheromone shutdown-related protein TraB|uniref:Conjugal transfer protein TraB n=1 Tax=Chromatium okenii TaxID=61644 RepID=A0A2S7XRU1_9GAMM|nr:TraB/GumN family protein [Chromatium okenii]PQJ96121.1 conjugal transfer protein TraB [Chromatium okenii]
MLESSEPCCEMTLDDVQITLLGTAHVSRISAEQVKRAIQSGGYDAVAVELCRSRFNALTDPRALAQMDLFSVIRQNRVAMVVANLALSAYQQRLAEQFGIEPGAEQRTALRLAKERELPILLIDREVGITLKRIAANLSWWKRYTLFAGLLTALVTTDEITEDAVEKLKEGDVLEMTFAEFAADQRDLYTPLIAERDQYMAAKLRREISRLQVKRVLVVVGVGHLRGIAEVLAQEHTPPTPTLVALEQIPPPSRWPTRFAWALLALILAGFIWGFAQDAALGWALINTWIVLTGGLAALGALVANAHPLTIVVAFLTAPLTTLNPLIAVGMVTVAVELYLRPPHVGDFSRLRADVAHWRGWWHNRVARIFVLFLLSNLGAAFGTYIAGFQIIGKLFHL